LPPSRRLAALLWVLSVSGLTLWQPAPAAAQPSPPPPSHDTASGPVIELPPEAEAAPSPPPAAPAPPTPKGPAADAAPAPEESVPLQSPYLVGDQPRRAIHARLFSLARESQIDVSLDPRAAGQRGATLGGYGEVTLNVPLDRSGPAIADLRRTVLYVGYNFTDHIRYFAEIEWEHAFTSSDEKGEIAVEQMIIDFTIRRYFNVRAGMTIVPINLVNLFHEPSTFNGVERPDVDVYIIPSTWKQLMVGFYGAVGALRYQLYATPGLRAEGFTAATGIRGGVQGNLTKTRDFGVTGRLDYAPLLGMNLGLSGYFAGASQGDPNLGDTRVAIAALDGRYSRAGFLVRAQLSYVYIDHAEKLNQTLALINPAAGPVARQLLGGYLEVGYDLLQSLHLRSGMQLAAFFRYDRTNTQLDVPEAQLGVPRAGGFDRSAYVTGLTFKPIFEVAVKCDYTYRHSELAGSGTHLADFALAYQF